METTQPPTSIEDNSKPPKIREQVIHGVRYVYEDYPYWDKNKKQIRHKRVYIGRYDNNGNFIESKLYKSNKNSDNCKLFKNCNLFGATYLLLAISKITGLYDDLKSSFPSINDKLLSLAFYLVLENNSPLTRFNKWEKIHVNPYGKTLDLQTISNLLSEITEDKKNNFFKMRINRCLSQEFLFYDITSMSSYSEICHKFNFIDNKEYNIINKINLNIIIDKNYFVPVYYRYLPDSISDLTMIKNFIIEAKLLQIHDLIFFMDKRSYNDYKINNLLSKEYKFILCVENNLPVVSDFIVNSVDKIDNTKNLLSSYNIYCQSKVINIYENLTGSEKFNVFLHIFYDPHVAISDKIAFQRKVKQAINNFYDNKASSQDLNFLHKYCYIIKKLNNDYQLKMNADVIDAEISKFGFNSLISNYVKDSDKALSFYMIKNIIEESFINLKDRFNYYSYIIKSDIIIEGAIFIQFIALSLTLYLHNKMKTNNLYDTYSLEELLDSLDIIKRYEYKDNEFYYDQISKEQAEIFKIFDIDIIEELNNKFV
jgi:hypothetical protein